jgi:hypothetical protein
MCPQAELLLFAGQSCPTRSRSHSARA